jgi:hypothetical protein
MRQPTVLPTPRWSLGGGVCAGCRESLLDHGPSRHYLCHLCVAARPHTPPCSSDAHAHFFSDDSGLTSQGTRSAHGRNPCEATSTGSGISGLQSFADLRAPTLARPPGRSHRSPVTGRPGRLHHASPEGLPTSGCGIATCLHGHLTRLDFHQLDGSLVGCSSLHAAQAWPTPLAERGAATSKTCCDTTCTIRAWSLRTVPGGRVHQSVSPLPSSAFSPQEVGQGLW